MERAKERTVHSTAKGQEWRKREEKQKLGPQRNSRPPRWIFASLSPLFLCPSKLIPPPHPMDSPVLSQLFRQLFRHPPCRSLKTPSPLSSHRAECLRQSGHSRQQCRPFLSRRTTSKRKKGDSELHWVRRNDYPHDIEKGLMTYPLVTAKGLRRRRERPREVQMLTREFVDGMKNTPNWNELWLIILSR